jgi:AbrB family looped-hinge helix DNA binding protein
MTAATITSKGQVTIPVDVRNHLGLESGDRIEFSFNEVDGPVRGLSQPRARSRRSRAS